MAAPLMSGWHFWIDRGGTFTDIVAWHPDVAGVRVAKVLSEDPARVEAAPLAAIRSVLELPVEYALQELGPLSIRMGTTVATNALLTGTGIPTVLVQTKGFGDHLLIDDQSRPDLFSLEMRRPRPAWHSIIEADERIGIDGDVVVPLDEQNLSRSLEEAFSGGARSCAISLVHGWRHPIHESRAIEIAIETGFSQVVAGHQVSPLEGVLARSQTTLIDAMLTPLLQDSIRSLFESLPEASIEFMQSSGGLARPDDFRGAQAVLSGPAGGIVGAVKTAEVSGVREIITFDMGGTSTDVAWYDGKLHRTWESKFNGLRLRVPMLEIDTIAAGGGSICRFDGQRLRVGPGSAGANPGPACYRMGGPATLTDCQMVLGRLDSDLLPSVFGSSRTEPADINASREVFQRISDSMHSHAKMSLEEIAEGCLKIAVEHMASAVRRISIEKGRSVEGVTMIAFGGAGGQTACLVAETLGIQRIIIHPQAGVLSALGMGLASPRLSSERTVGCPVDGEHAYRAVIDDLEKDLVHQMSERGVARDKLGIRRRLHLQVAGWDGSLSVEQAEPGVMRTSFLEKAHERYGFHLPADSPLMVDMVEVEVEVREAVPVLSCDSEAVSGIPLRRTNAWFRGSRMEVDVWHRSAIDSETRIQGPAIIAEDGSTTILEPGWNLSGTPQGDLLLEHVSSAPVTRAYGEDPVSLEIFSHRFMSIAEEMGVTLRQTAHSVNIKERLDFSCAIFTADGQLVANGPHVPVHLGSMDHSVMAVIDGHAHDLRPGDAWLLNDPYHGGTHLPDLTLVTPVFVDDGQKLAFFVASRGHHADVGGLTPGSMPADSRTLEDEGAIISPVRIVHDGRMNEPLIRDLFTSIQHPSRNPDQNIADLRAQMAANARGVEELTRLVATHGIGMIVDCMEAVIDAGEACVRRLLPTLREGSCEANMDHGSTIRVATRLDGDSFVFDFGGTSKQVPLNFNAPPAITRAVILYVLRCLIDDDIPLNAGCLRPIRIEIPSDSLLNPRSPSAVVAGNVETSQCVADTLLAALGVQAASQGTMNNLTFGNNEYQYYETVCGGVGAGDGFHGADAVHSHMTNSRLTDPEILESRFPVRLDRFAVRAGSGGNGRWRGGEGVIRQIRFLQDMTLTLLAGRRSQPPFGLAGGAAGSTGSQFLIRADGEMEPLSARCTIQVAAGDVFHLETPGGGGFGPVS
ncbi:MAG: 5-oxoprolinase [Phycisphaerae bacterium]|nr:5-oxoprolinase [Phycisphaerae bacterium]